MLFSFIITSYNNSHHVKRAIESINSQPNWANISEIIVIDDGTEQTDLSLQKYFKHPQINFIKSPYHIGSAEAKNIGICNAKNKFVILLNANNLIAQNSLPHLKNLVKNNNYDLFFCGIRVLNDGKLMYNPDFTGNKSYYDLLINSVGTYLPICNTKLMKNNLFRNIKGYENMAWYNLAKQGYKLYFDKEPICLYDNCQKSHVINSKNQIDGYHLFLKEFGLDLKYLNYNEYLKLNFKLFCSYFLSFSFTKAKPSKI